MPIDIPGHDEQPSTPETVGQRVWDILTRFDPARVTAAQNITHAQERQKQRYDVTVQPRPFDIGEKVLLREASYKTDTTRSWNLIGTVLITSTTPSKTGHTGYASLLGNS